MKTKKLKLKKGQITIFIILGIIILFVVALVIYLQESYNIIKPPVQQLVVDEELKPIQSYVTDCLTAVSKDALIRLGQNGGYIELPSGIRVNAAKIYNSDVLFFPPQTMPYWYYMKPCPQSSIGCIFINNPPVCSKGTRCVIPYTGDNSMEEQLSNFIEKNINVCIADFEPFKDRFEIIVADAKVTTQITAQEVSFKLEYPIEITTKGSTSKAKLSEFYTTHKLKLAQIYSLAQDIRDAEANYTFLERNTLNLMSAYSDIDSNSLPPMSGMEVFTLKKTYWILSEVKDKMRSDILPYTMLLQIVNAGNAQNIIPRGTNAKYIGFEQGLYDSMMLKVSNKTYSELNANIYYPQDADIYLKIGNSQIIKPKSFGADDNIILKMIGFALNDYSFRYDLTYPVIVMITDPNAFNGEGYVFNYAMQANIRQNVPINSNMTILNVVGTPTIDMEDPALRINRKIIIESYNKYTKEPLDDVIINYRCGYDIFIGNTVLKDGKAVLEDKFPFCEFGGEIAYEKSGYMSGVIDYSNTQGSDTKIFTIEMWPIQEKKFKVYKRTNDDINGIRNLGAGGIVFYDTKYTELSTSDSVFLNIERIKEDSREGDVPLIGFFLVKNKDAQTKVTTKQDQIDYVNNLFTQGQINESARDAMLYDLSFVTDTPVQVLQVSSQETEYVAEFVPGTYNIDAFMTYDGNILIAEKKESICAVPEVLGVCIPGKQDIIFPEQNFSSWINGGVNINFTLTENDVYNDNTLIIYVAEIPLPTDWDTLQTSPTIEEYQQDKAAFLNPSMEYN